MLFQNIFIFVDIMKYVYIYIYHVSNLIILILIKVYMHVKHNEFFLLYFMSLQSYNLKTEDFHFQNTI